MPSEASLGLQQSRLSLCQEGAVVASSTLAFNNLSHLYPARHARPNMNGNIRWLGVASEPAAPVIPALMSGAEEEGDISAMVAKLTLIAASVITSSLGCRITMFTRHYLWQY